MARKDTRHRHCAACGSSNPAGAARCRSCSEPLQKQAPAAANSPGHRHRSTQKDAAAGLAWALTSPEAVGAEGSLAEAARAEEELPEGPLQTLARPEAGTPPDPGTANAKPSPVSDPRRLAEARVPTFVPGFDEAMGGGIPAGSVVVVAGSAGTMKSSLTLSILLNNAAQGGTRALYASLEERPSSLLKQAIGLGLDTTSIPFKVRFLEFSGLQHQTAGGNWLDYFQSSVLAARATYGCDILVIDGLEGLAARMPMEDRRRDLFRFFEWLRSLDVTVLLTAERPDVFVNNAVVMGRWDEDFLADGVIHLRLHVAADHDVQRRIRCVKMRRAAHDPSYLTLLVDGGRFVATKPMRTG